MLTPESIEKIKTRMALASVFEEDLEESFILGSGPGGQKTNKTSSTVRLCHAPSGLTVKCGQHRSREMNRWLARRELAEKILERENAARSARQQAAEKIRRQKRRRSRRQKARILDEKHRHGEKKAARGKVAADAGD
jgi:protein subunit release factor B